jgi:hypothetical protein
MTASTIPAPRDEVRELGNAINEPILDVTIVGISDAARAVIAPVLESHAGDLLVAEHVHHDVAMLDELALGDRGDLWFELSGQDAATRDAAIVAGLHAPTTADRERESLMTRPTRSSGPHGGAAQRLHN